MSGHVPEKLEAYCTRKPRSLLSATSAEKKVTDAISVT